MMPKLFVWSLNMKLHGNLTEEEEIGPSAVKAELCFIL